MLPLFTVGLFLLTVRPVLESIKFPEPSTIRVLEPEVPLLFIEEPPVVDEPLFTEELLVVEEPLSTDEPLVVEEPLSTDELLEDVPAVLLYVFDDLPLSLVRLTELLDDALVRPDIPEMPDVDDLPLLDDL